MNNLTDWKWRCRFSLGVSPRLFYPAYRVYYHLNPRKIHEIERFTRESTEIAIEGFPRSANTSTVGHFQTFNPRVRIAHHHHVPAQVIRAVELGIPAIVLIRPPEEAISSLKCLEPKLPLETVIEGYRSFYETLLPYSENYVIAPFDRLFTDFDGIIDRVNRKFETRFSIGAPLPRLQTFREAKFPYLHSLQRKRYRAMMRSTRELYQTYLALEQNNRPRILQRV
ncbi:hypothetical protein V0288_21790 [Pannus brasiliensis CCIBt3594]|uniref:Uncharacterized protein n=1 Tax=Pannus brasiliensis CCIBt3594 TaxID=1427578 RepID=A0AAW9QSB7_9CHRO